MSSELAKYIDHTQLNPHASKSEITKLCDEAKEHNFYAVCVNPYYVQEAKYQLKSSKVQVACVVGFPLGANLTELKVLELNRAINDGADEIDLVINIGALKNKEFEYVEQEIAECVKAAGDVPVKVIIECDLLSKEEKVAATEACIKAGAFMVKTSTGFVKDGKGATVEDVALMKATIGKNKLGIKASAGIRDYKKAKELIDAGAQRIGTSSGIAILTGAKAGAAAY